jgi:hypothetical protein
MKSRSDARRQRYPVRAMLDTANHSDLLLIQIMAGLRHRYESLNRHYEEQLINDFRVNASGKSLERDCIPARPTSSAFSFRRWQLLSNAIKRIHF